jgi:hypothetical protein
VGSAKSLERQPLKRGEKAWTAVEDAEDIFAAVGVWRKKIATNAQVLPGFGGGDVFWNKNELFWSHFSGTPLVPFRRKEGNYWNPFGLVAKNFRGNMIVEINPPVSGINTNVQGAVALDERKRRWILHAGRLSLPRKKLKAEEFDKQYPSQRIPVKFSDGSIFRYHPVAMIDGQPRDIQKQTAEFVRRCSYIRNYYQYGAQEADRSRVIEAAERQLFPETDGKYAIPARAAAVADRHHAKIWKALEKALSAKGLELGNTRVGRYAPDMYCTSTRPKMLFEIKSTASPADVYEGFGQLHIYEKLRGGSHRKVLVMPTRPRGEIQKILAEYEIDVLTFTYTDNRVVFSRGEIDQLL